LRGRARRTAGDNAAAEALLTRVAEGSRADDPDMAAEAMVECSRSVMVRGDYASVVARCDEAAGLARAPRVRASAQALGGVAAMYAGDSARGTALLEAARAAFATLALPREEATLLVYLAIAREKAGDLPGARMLHEQSLERARAAGDLRGMVTARANLGHIAQRVGDLGASIEHNEAGLKLAWRAGIRTAVLTTRLNMASQLIRVGSMERAHAELDAALALAKEAGHRELVASATLMLGYLVARGGETDRGLGMIAESEAMFTRLGHGDDAADALLDAAEVLIDRGGGGDVERAAEKIARAREVTGGALGLAEARARMLEGSVAVARGDARAALRALGEAASLAEKENAWEVLTNALTARAAAHEATGAELHARRDRERAIEVLEEKASLLPPDLRGAFWSVPRRAAQGAGHTRRASQTAVRTARVP
jgi:tetratricopeptide (TPR) repeat protein